MEFHFIEPEEKTLNPKSRQPASYIRKSFQIKKGILSVQIRMTALGVYHPFFNGEALDDQMLLPGFTDYKRRVQYQEYDVTSRIHEGENVVGCILGDGWYRGCLGAFNKRNVYGTHLKFACQIMLHYPENTEIIHTDSSWRAYQQGPLRENDLKLSEVYNAQMELKNWNNIGYKDSKWHDCRSSIYTGTVVPSLGEKILPQEHFSPTLITTPDGSTILDFGQNLAGIVKFTVTGKAGHQVSLIMGETLDENGNFTLKNLQGEGRAAKLLALGQKLTYILKDGTQTYRPHFLICGFRYVKLENWPEKIQVQNFQSISVHSVLKKTGSFSCSNPLINQLVKNVIWSEKSNFVDIPTDCPQRERAGWTGDINVFIETANYLTDTRKFISKWMLDFIGMQESDGALPFIVPKIPIPMTGRTSTGWSDAITTLPMAQYYCYGEIEDIENAYAAAKRYVEYNRALATRKHLFHIYKRGLHRKYILDVGFHFGEWLEPQGSNFKDGLKALLYPDPEVATAWFYYSSKLLSRMAEILGKEDDAIEYRHLAQNIKQAYRTEFLSKGIPHSTRQCKFVRPIYMGLADPDECSSIAHVLNTLCVDNNYRIGTGFLTTYQILNVLTDYGHSDTAYKMLENEDCPGWLYEIKQGATTIWEGWDAIQNGKLKPLSQNHYAAGSVVAWLFSRCAGIRSLKPGYREIELHPIPGGTLTYADATYESVVGRIRSHWVLQNGEFVLYVELPPGIPATIILPDGSIHKNAVSGTYRCPYIPDIQRKDYNNESKNYN